MTGFGTSRSSTPGPRAPRMPPTRPIPRSRKGFSMRFIKNGLLLLAAACLAASLSCGKDEQEAQKFNRADEDTFKRDMSDLTSFKLSNGITVYLQEERTDHQVAIEAIYRAGYTNDPKGEVQLAHLAEHLSMKCATGNMPAGESMDLVREHHGMISAEAVADFIHIDYVVDAENLDETLGIEASRLREIRCDEDVLKAQKAEVLAEFDRTLADPKSTLTRLSLMALAQVAYFGQTHIPIRAGVDKLTLDEVHRFHQAFYRPDDMILVLIGNFTKADAEALVRKHFESIPSRAGAPDPTFAIARSMRVTWDLPASVIYLVSPGPFESFEERMILSMFGAYFRQVLNNSQDAFGVCKAIACSNQVYSVGRLPFFIFAQPKEGFTNQNVLPILYAHLDQTVAALNDKQVEMIKTSMTSFVTTSMLKANVPDYPLMHHQVIGQEGLNIGMKDMLRDGRSVDEFVGEIETITPDEFRAVIAKRVSRAALLNVSVEQGR